MSRCGSALCSIQKRSRVGLTEWGHARRRVAVPVRLVPRTETTRFDYEMEQVSATLAVKASRPAYNILLYFAGNGGLQAPIVIDLKTCFTCLLHPRFPFPVVAIRH